MKTRILSAYFLNQREWLSKRENRIKLLKWAYNFSPVISLDTTPCTENKGDGFYGINLEVTGCERLFKTEANLIKKFEQGLRKFGFKSRIVVAPTLGAAWALSRYRKEKALIIEYHELEKALAPLPLESLRINQKTVRELYDVNLLYVLDLLSIPKASLATRFDKELIKRLNQALGVEQEMFCTTRFVPSLKRIKIFKGAVKEKSALEHTARELLSSLFSEIIKQSKKPASITIETKAIHSPAVFKTISLSMASLNETHVWGLIKNYIETLQVTSGVEYLGLSITKSEAIIAKQNGSSNKDDNSSASLGKLIDSLYHRLGKDRVLQLKPKASHIPEKSFSFTYISLHKRKAAPVVETERPSLLFSNPRLINAMSVLPDGGPFSLSWQNDTHRINKSFGPERISPNWWDKEDDSLKETRDYFRVQLNCGTWAWIFREIETSKW